MTAEPLKLTPTRPPAPSAPGGPTLAVLRRRARRLAWATVAYNTVEGLVAVAAGAAAGSVALVSFGLDSGVEVLSALAVAWQFAGGGARAQERERRTLRLIAVAFLALAGYVAFESMHHLLAGHASDPSPVGIALAASSLVVMPALVWAKRRVGRALGSASMLADSTQTLLCTYLSAVLLVGLVANAALGWWWADPVTGLVIAVVAAKEGVDAWRGGGGAPGPPPGGGGGGRRPPRGHRARRGRGRVLRRRLLRRRARRRGVAVSALALVLYVAGVVVVLGGRSWAHRRATGSSGVHGVSGRPGSAGWWGGVLFVAALVLGVAAPALAAAVVVAPPAGLPGPAVAVVGLVLALAGFAGVLVAQGGMGASWRVGVDERERTVLVTDGPFRRVRNPIFTAMVVAQLGVALMAPTWLSALGVACLVAAVQLQVRAVEEPYLSRVHGEAYLAYAARAGRFLPGVGRLGPGASARPRDAEVGRTEHHR